MLVSCEYNTEFEVAEMSNNNNEKLTRPGFIAEIVFPICMYTTCMFAVNMDYLPRHMKTKHGWGADEIAEVVQEMETLVSQTKHTVDEEKLKQDYFAAGTDCAKSSNILPCLPSLPVLEGMKCHLCSYCAVSFDTMKKHWSGCHQEVNGADVADSGLRSLDALPKVLVQSIFGGNKRRYFEVNEHGSNSNYIEGPMRFLKEFKGSAISTAGPSETSHMNSFLATARFDNHLSESHWHGERMAHDSLDRA